jgi:hypothetical protein
MCNWYDHQSDTQKKTRARATMPQVRFGKQRCDSITAILAPLNLNGAHHKKGEYAQERSNQQHLH